MKKWAWDRRGRPPSASLRGKCHALGQTRHFYTEKMVCPVGPVLVHFQNKIEQNTNTK